MSTVEEITAAIEQLPADDVARVRAWLAEYAERLWDEQIERDERDGRLDALIDKALEEHRAGGTRPLSITTPRPTSGNAMLDCPRRCSGWLTAITPCCEPIRGIHPCTSRRSGGYGRYGQGPDIGPWRPKPRTAWFGSGSDPTISITSLANA